MEIRTLHEFGPEWQHNAPKHLPIVGIFGGIGPEVHSIVDALHDSQKYDMRVFVRHRPDRDTSRSLKSARVKILQTNEGNMDSLREVLHDCHAVWAMTNWNDPETRKNGFDYGKNIVDAARHVGTVKHFIWSDLPDTHQLSSGRWIPHQFTDKAEVRKYAMKQKFEVKTNVQLGFSYQSWMHEHAPKQEGDSFLFQLPLPEDKPLASFDMTDLGHVLLKILDKPNDFNNETVCLAGENRTPKEYVDCFSKVTGLRASYQEIPMKDMDPLVPKAKELIHTWNWIREYGFFGPHADLSLCQKYHKMKTFEEWLRETKWKGQAVIAAE